MPEVKLQCPPGPKGNCFIPLEPSWGWSSISSLRSAQAVPGLFPLYARRRMVLVLMLPLSSVLGLLGFILYPSTRSACTTALCRFLIIQVFCSLCYPEVVSLTLCNPVALGLCLAMPPKWASAPRYRLGIALN